MKQQFNNLPSMDEVLAVLTQKRKARYSLRKFSEASGLHMKQVQRIEADTNKKPELLDTYMTALNIAVTFNVEIK